MEIPTSQFYSKACKTMLKSGSVRDFKNTFQDKYKVTRITLTEAILLPCCHQLIDMFLFCRVLPCATTQRNFQGFSKKYMWSSSSSFFMPKQQPRPQNNSKKNVFRLSHCSEKMRWGQG